MRQSGRDLLPRQLLRLTSPVCGFAAAMLTLTVASEAYAFEFDTGNAEVKARWDNTLKYSAGWRVKERSDRLVADANLDDGNRNFDKGLVSNRLDLLSEFDMSYKEVGMRLVAAAWYDDVYNKSNDNDSPATANALSVRNNEFTTRTKRLHGSKSELLDAFIYGNGDLGTMPGTLRLGRHTLLYGESLFFGENGIANAQAPIDVVKVLTVPSSQFKEIMRPVEQLSGQLQLSSNVSIGAYYQWKWHKSQIPGAGSYLSDTDFVGDGAERLIAGAPGGPFAGPPAFFRASDISAKDSGQGGVQLRFRPEAADVDFGLYAVRYHEKTPQIYLRPQAVPNFATGQIGDLVHVYHEGVKSYGASVSTSVGPVNVAGEVSVRRNTSLVSDPQTDATGRADNKKNPLYAVGNSAHAQVSAIYLLSPTALWDGGTFLGEIAWNRRTSITKNAGALDPNSTRDAWGLRFIFEPTYFRVLPGLDINVPIGVGYNPEGRSSTMLKFNRATIEGGGDFSIGVTGTYENTWKFGLTYTKFFGSEDQFLTPNSAPGARLSYEQTLKDRDFVSFNVQRTF